MPLHQRPSANVGKRTTMSQSVSYYTNKPGNHPNNHSSQVLREPAERTRQVEVEAEDEDELDDYESQLLDDLNKANTELNKSNAEKDKLKTALEAAEKKLAETVTAYRELKAQHEGVRNENGVLKEDIRQLNTDNSRLEFERCDFEQQFIAIKAKHENLSMRFSALSATTPPSAMTSPLPLPQEQLEPKPERIKTSSRPSSKASGSSGKSTSSTKSPTKKDREERHERHHREDRPRDERHREERPRRERTDKEREQRDKEKSEAKAEKERLSKRFDERPALPGRQTSFIEPWGPGAKSAKSAKSGRSHSSVVSSSHHSAYANVPRTTNISLSGHSSSDSSNFDEDAYEDGNYHPYPIVN